MTLDAFRGGGGKLRGMTNKANGFTIVELLIVIVVIAILAALSYVGYTNISDRAADSAVQSDLRNFAGKVQEYYAIEGVGSTSTNGPSGLSFSVARSAYATNMHNFVYCKNSQAGADDFIIAAASKSGKRFAYISGSGLGPYAPTWGGVIDVCRGQGWSSGIVSYGYNNNGTWWPWTQ